MLGYSPEDLLGASSVLEFVAEEDRTLVENNLRRRQGGEAQGMRYTFRGRKKDGSMAYLEAFGSRIPFEGRFAVTSTVSDITERKRAEEALRQVNDVLRIEVSERSRAEMAYRESEQQMRLFMEATSDCLWNWDLISGNVVRSIGFNRAFGYSAQEMDSSITWWEQRLHPADRGKVISTFQDTVASGGNACSYEYRFRCKDGTHAVINDHAYIVRDAKGKPLRALGAMTDITGRKQAEKALRDSEERFHAIASHTPDHILLQDRDLRYQWVVNPHLGLTEADMIGKTDRDFLGKEVAEKLTAIKRKVLETGESAQLETSLQNPKGETEIFEGVYVPRFDSTGKVDGIIGYFHNVTERKRAEEALKASETRYRSLFRNMIEGFAYCRMLFEDGRPQDYIYLEVNDAFQTLTGLKNVVGRNVSEVIPGIRESNPELFERYGRVALTGRSERFETYIAALNMWRSISVYCPEMEHFVTVFDDITERKRAEEALRKTSKRLRDLSQRLIKVEDTVRRTINRELHDRVGASLSALNLNLTIVRSQLPQESLRAIGTRLEDGQKLLEEATTHIRDLMADLHPPALDDYGLLAALRTYVESLGARFAVPISVHGEDLVPRLPLAAETALFRVAQGALMNAVTHAQAKRIEILLAASPDRTALTIADDGIGFDVAQTSMAHPTWGLVIMRERAEAVGAELTVESTPGKGTRVCVEISREKR